MNNNDLKFIALIVISFFILLGVVCYITTSLYPLLFLLCVPDISIEEGDSKKKKRKKKKSKQLK